MANFLSRARERLRGAFHPSKPWVARTQELGRSRRVRKTGVIVVAVVLFLGLATYIAVPPILRHVLTGSVATSIHRQVTVGKIRFNLYRLKLDLDQLHVGERDDPQKPFVDLGHLTVKVSWTSLFRLAPVVGEVVIDKPAIHVVRESQQKFNFSDLLESAPAPAKPKPTAPSSPQRFAVSNIQLRDGEITIDDQLLGKQHKVDKIQINVPFIANLPADVDVFVQPLVQMVIDGSPLRIAGVAKPFQATRDSVVDLKLHRLDLPLYVSYAPMKLPVKISSGALSTDLYVHFVQAESQPLIRINGTVALDQIDVRDTADAPLVALKHAEVKLTDVEPLGAVFYLRSIWIDGLMANIRLNGDGTNNLSSLASGNTAPAATPPAQVAAPSNPSAAPTPAGNVAQQAVPVAGPSTAKPPMDFQLESFVLTKSGVNVQDNSGPTPATEALDALEVGVKDLQTLGKSPATFYVNTNIHSGGALAVTGALDLSQSQVTTDVSIDKIDLPSLQPFAQKFLAATVASGKFNAKATVQTHFASEHFNVHAEPASVAIDNFEVDAPHEKEKPVLWKNFSVAIGQFDLASRKATVTEVKGDGMHLFVRRGRDGKLSLESLMRGGAAPEAPPSRTARSSVRESRRMPRERRRAERKPVPPAAPAVASPSFQFQVASVSLDQTDATFIDESAPKPVTVAVAPLNLHLKDVTSDFTKPFGVDIDGTLNRKGTFKVTGTAAIAPLKADLRIGTKRLDLTFADPYVSSRLNAIITSANLTMDGAVGLEQQRKDFLVSYKGNASLGSVRMLDKLTNDLFFRMNALNVNGIDFALGKGPPKVHVGLIALNDFYSRIILNSTGKLNLKDITANPQEAPTSLTRATGEPGSKGAVPVAPTSTATPAAAPSVAAATAPGASPGAEASPAQPYQGQPMNADVELKKITLKGGKVDYTDNFIKPNYTANMTDMEGSVGAFGTKSTQPAPVSLDGKINGSSPLNIDGSINPLAPTAFVDIKAKADAIELTGVSPYTLKYTGYPITKGTLTVDVHYLLDTGKLTADNHIFIDQLTFGDHVDSPSATNLPIRLAVSLLKNSKGQIDVRIPISGSLSDPQFSIGSVILGAFMNLIVKAATAPFSLIASAFGSVTGGGAPQDLAYIEFKPGYSTLTPESKQKLDTVAKALADRTALKLNIEGRVDPKFDTDGYKEASLDHSILVLSHKAGGDSADGKAQSAALSTEDYNKYLKKVYSAGDFKKPRDAVGLAKTQPPDEMKKLILANTPVTDQDLKNLADARANAVRAYLGSKQVDSGRMFIVAPKLDANGIKDQGKTTRVDLSLE
jgi:Domain of Unknown Function (DUF748)